ncbi:PAQR family membrane homeostasis protein TrhA [Salinibacillus xinjiangensis]|uniref:Hemolysin III family protein n=1 Tax=Salinibacillus xinjiangensis TaxID=1229268 RepID=A0A6G1X422_9BACI|nr:hemolysin III family protein [Salinibacillus xinjiangensis]MRG85578.1 hemolysin III family protein [Salinibacillus xinjiangensis]
MMNVYTYSRKEEIANALTHGVGALLSIVALATLITYASGGSVWQIISVIIYGITMFMMYISSTIVHVLNEGKLKDFFLILDHSSIFLFIAGTYTPITLLLLKGTLGWTLFLTVWSVALFGVLFKIIFVRKFMFMTTLLYMLLGWFIVIAWEPLSSKLAFNGILLLVLGGLCYSVGTIFYLWRGFPYHHAIWHILVVFGSAFHFFTILKYVLA